MRFLLIVLVIAAVGLALAWWSSGRSRPASRDAAAGRLETENTAMRQHRPGGRMSGGPQL